MAIYNHTGQVVSDLERAKRFYQKVFGFKFWYEITPPDGPTAKLSGLTPPLGTTASYLTFDGLCSNSCTTPRPARRLHSGRAR